MTENEYDDFACKHGEDGPKECAEVREWAYKYLSTDKYPTTAENFLSKFMYNMLLAYHVEINFFADQWGGISCSNEYLKDPDRGNQKYKDEIINEFKTKDTFTTFIQCDDFEDGLAYTLKAWIDHYGEENE